MRLEVAQSEFGMAEVTAYGGVDIVVYRVPQPLTFLKQQKNLHRVKVEGRAAEEGLANTMSHLWDRWVQASRRSWRKIFSSEARQEVTRQAPELKTSPGLNSPTSFRVVPQFKPLAGFELVDRFRYPVQSANPIQPPPGVRLAGSSSEFIQPSAGNVMIPIGRQKPGLYLIEAYVGSYRATTLLFVSDTIAITKVSAGELLVWAAARTSGAAVPSTAVAWTDGIGVMQSGKTDAEGIARFTREAPERSYVFGEDPGGGVFVSENFYYDSEIYDTKLYAVTDRPLYRPGDRVFVKIFGREFLSAQQSAPAVEAEIQLTAYDPGGAPVASERLKLSALRGGDTSFRLPENAPAGGYELRFSYRDAQYSAAFRVAEYVKPHFEIALAPDRPAFKVKEPISGRLQLNYTNGKPVRNAAIQLTVRSQRLSLVDGELGYYGQFPVKIETETLVSDGHGEARFTLPAVDEPSRYLITVMATDGAAYRVKTTKELLIERAQGSFSLRAERQFSAPNDKVAFAIKPSAPSSTKPASWEWVRLEDQRHASGGLSSATSLDLTFAEAGSYTLQLRDASGDVVAATAHWVSGAGLKAPTGSIEIVPSKERYQPGETAELLVTFPVPVEQALLTLERDRVERATLLQKARSWVAVKRLAPTQWRARVPLTALHAPNITFSVVYVKDGDFVFQNQGLEVAQPRIEITFEPEKAVYAPGETVNVKVQTTVGGKPGPATVAVGVVDEMIYVLQPEIAPDIYDFFYHARRNNVRTSSSLSFITYDLASSRSKGAAELRSTSERRVKVLERPRRDEVDTAFWQPSLATDVAGRARFSFVMPDALTRWRIQGRAQNADGIVGQRTASIRSEKELYVKWTSPNWMRSGDAPVASLAAFNQTSADQAVTLQVAGPGLERSERLVLKPGVSFIAQPLASVRRDGMIAVSLTRADKVVDALETRFAREPAGWRGPRTQVVQLAAAQTPLGLPPDARDIRVTFASSAAAHYGRVIDDLLEYPYGCVEQTASRMIPFALAIEALQGDKQANTDWLRQQLNGQRLRLAYMASPKAVFTWWGVDTTADPLLTAYAYYADWIAVRTLRLEIPTDHWQRLLDVYRESGHALPLPQRALMLSFMQEMGLPVKGLVDGLVADVIKGTSSTVVAGGPRLPEGDSVFLGHPDGPLANAFALALVERLARSDKRTLPPGLARQVTAAAEVLRASKRPDADAVLMANDRLGAEEAERVLAAVRAEMPTLERALALVWIRDSLTASPGTAPSTLALDGPWERSTTASGGAVWRWPAGRGVPKELKLKDAPPAHAAALVQFESAAQEAGGLGAKITRRFYRVTKAEQGFDLKPVAAGAPFSTNDLYLDDIEVAPSGAPLRFAVLEAPLPPGASVESSTWGVDLRRANGNLEGLERARHQPTRFGYAVPLDAVARPTHIRHLLRFAEAGTFTFPRARAYRMYQPAAKAFEDGTAPWSIEVR